MIEPGLVSITFRKLSPARVIGLAAEAGLSSIEWGGDVHVPVGDLKTASDVRRQTREAGLSVSAYGAYYRAGISETAGMAFESVLQTALTLGAPIIRVWAGNRASADSPREVRARVVADSRRIARMAAAEGVRVACEHHANTLTDTTESALTLLRETSDPNLGAFWQPPNTAPFDERLAGLRALLPWLTNVHVFHWTRINDRNERRPLAEGERQWAAFLRTIRATGRAHHASIEFVADDEPDNLRRDAAVLKDWLARQATPGDTGR